MSAAGGRITAGAGANLLGQNHHDRNQDATCYVGNLERQVTEEILWEIFVQAGPLVNVYLPKDRITGAHQGYGFVEFKGEQDADYVSEESRADLLVVSFLSFLFHDNAGRGVRVPACGRGDRGYDEQYPRF